MEGKAPIALKCPECGDGLKEVYAEANYGRVLLLEQCQRCGGVWFDRWELYFLEESSARSLGAFDIKSFMAENPDTVGTGQCPKCSVKLVEFKDPGLPKDCAIERCTGCGGLWLNRGELHKYADHKEAIKGAASGGNDKTNAEPVQGGNAESKTLKHLQKELNVSNITQPGWSELIALQPDDGPIETKEVLKDMGFLALQSLLRYVLKF